MTLPLRKKGRTIVPVPSMPARMAASVLGLFLAGSAAPAQQVASPARTANWPPFIPATREVLVSPAAPAGQPGMVMTDPVRGIQIQVLGQPTVTISDGWRTPVAAQPAPAARGAPSAHAPVAVSPSVPPGTVIPSASAVTPAASWVPDQGPVIQQTNRQMAGGRTATDETPEYQIQLEVPSLERVTRRESDLNLQERIRQENKNRPSADRIEFPSEPPLSTDT